MEILALILSIIALIFSILAYQKAGGVADLKKQTEVLSNLGESIVKATDSLRDKTADIFEKIETAVRSKEGTKEEEQTKSEEARKAREEEQ